jgi:hypothetical protein
MARRSERGSSSPPRGAPQRAGRATGAPASRRQAPAPAVANTSSAAGSAGDADTSSDKDEPEKGILRLDMRRRPEVLEVEEALWGRAGPSSFTGEGTKTGTQRKRTRAFD